MKNCPICQTPTKVVDARTRDDGFIRRRRACPSCGHRVTTIEIQHSDDPRFMEQLHWIMEGGEG
jgi:transcriptional regulator NrdR family protein